jgi:hypothetical protein
MVREESHWVEEGYWVREGCHWLKRRVTGKRGEPLGRRGTLLREERHWVEEGQWLERSVTG